MEVAVDHCTMILLSGKMQQAYLVQKCIIAIRYKEVGRSLRAWPGIQYGVAYNRKRLALLISK